MSAVTSDPPLALGIASSSRACACAARPNETTWTVFKKKIEAQRAKDAAKPARTE